MRGLETGSPSFRRASPLPDSGLPSRQGGRALCPILPLPDRWANLEQGLNLSGLLQEMRMQKAWSMRSQRKVTPDDGGGRCCPKAWPPGGPAVPPTHLCPINTHTPTISRRATPLS